MTSFMVGDQIQDFLNAHDLERTVTTLFRPIVCLQGVDQSEQVNPVLSQVHFSLDHA